MHRPTATDQHERDPAPNLDHGAHPLSPLWALLAGSVGVVAVVIALIPFGADLPRVVPALLLLAPIVGAGLLGGRLVAAAVAIEAAMIFATAFLPPIGSPAVELGHDAIALAIFVIVAGALAVIISTVLDAERRRVVAERGRVEALTDVDRQRAALLRSVSHDLRTPLASIRAVVTDLRAGAPFDPATRDALLDLVATEAERLDRLVANLLSMSRIEAGALRPVLGPLDLGEVVDEVISSLTMALTNTAVHVQVPEDLPMVLGDVNQITQVVANLVENAARHSPPGGAVRVGAIAGERTVRLIVEDDGPGIGDDDRDRIFGAFETGPGTATTGLGLAICRSVVEAHGGTIELDGSYVGGTRIAVELPVDGAHGPGDRR